LQAGSLTIVGTGIQVGAHTTQEAIAQIRQADRVLYVMADQLAQDWLDSLNPNTESLFRFYGSGKSRLETYRQMVDRILELVREGLHVCAAFYGHPGVFVNPSHEAVRRARAEGFAARMLPGISAEDCLFADLGVDPGPSGCQSFEATDFLLCRRVFDPTSALVIWQAGCVGDLTFQSQDYNPRGLAVLTEVLLHTYPPDHEVVIYQAAHYLVCDPIIERRPLAELAARPISAATTLYVAPLSRRLPDVEMAQRLGLEEVLPQLSA